MITIRQVTLLTPDKKILDQTIEKLPTKINRREKFVHWKIDTVLLTLVKRQACFEILIKLKEKDKVSVVQAISSL